MVHGKLWSDEEIEFVRKNYQDMSDEEIAEELNRTASSIRNRRRREDWTKAEHNERSWSKDEVAFLRENYDELDRKERSVQDKRRRLGLTDSRKWTDSDVEFLRDNWEDMSDEAIADRLDHGVHGTVKKRCELGLTFDNFIETDRHFDWEELCVEIAESIHGEVCYHEVFDDGSYIPDIFVPSKNLVIDAKMGVYDGSVEDVRRYLEIDGVERVELWSYRPYRQRRDGVVIKDREKLKREVGEDLTQRIEGFDTESSDAGPTQLSLVEVAG